MKMQCVWAIDANVVLDLKAMVLIAQVSGWFNLISILILCFKDVNECEAEKWPCDPNAECINTPGSFYCECLPGYAGNGRQCSTGPS